MKFKSKFLDGLAILSNCQGVDCTNKALFELFSTKSKANNPRNWNYEGRYCNDCLPESEQMKPIKICDNQACNNRITINEIECKRCIRELNIKDFE